MRWRDIVGQTPTLGPDDRQGAARFLRNIQVAIDHGGWSKSVWAVLYKFRDKWAARVDGRDARFRIVGNQRRGLMREELVIMRQYQSENERDGGSNSDSTKEQSNDYRSGQGRMDDAEAKSDVEPNTAAEGGERSTGDATERCPVIREHANRPGYGWGGRKYRRIG